MGGRRRKRGLYKWEEGSQRGINHRLGGRTEKQNRFSGCVGHKQRVSTLRLPIKATMVVDRPHSFLFRTARVHSWRPTDVYNRCSLLVAAQWPSAQPVAVSTSVQPARCGSRCLCPLRHHSPGLPACQPIGTPVDTAAAGNEDSIAKPRPRAPGSRRAVAPSPFSSSVPVIDPS